MAEPHIRGTLPGPQFLTIEGFALHVSSLSNAVMAGPRHLSRTCVGSATKTICFTEKPSATYSSSGEAGKRASASVAILRASSIMYEDTSVRSLASLKSLSCPEESVSSLQT